jgi:hypothetical protein
MSALSINPPFPVFPDTDGQPLEDGYIWIGVADLNPLTNPIVVYWDAALTLPAGQPVRTINGFPSRAGTPARLYAGSDYSIQVQNKNGSVVYSSANATELLSSDLVTFIQAGAGAVQRTAQNKMRDFVSVKDFGAVGDGATDDTAAIWNAIISLRANPVTILDTIGGNLITVYSSGTVYFPPGAYKVTPDQFKIYQDLGLILKGSGSRRTNNAVKGSTTLLISGTSSGFGIQAYRNGGRGLTIEDMDICYETSAFTGSVVDIVDCPGVTLNRVYLGTYGITGPTRLTTAIACLRSTYDEFITLNNCVLSGAQRGWWSDDTRTELGNTFGGSVTHFNDCVFYDFSENMVYHGGSRTRETVNFTNTVFNPIAVSPSSSGINMDNVDGLNILGCNFAPSTTEYPASQWLRATNATAVINGNIFGDLAASALLSGQISLNGNKFAGTAGPTMKSGVISGANNEFQTGTGPLINPDNSIVVNLGPDLFKPAITYSYDIPADSAFLAGKIHYDSANDSSINKFRNTSVRVTVRNVDEKIFTVSSSPYVLSSLDTGRCVLASGVANQAFTLPAPVPGTRLSVVKISSVNLTLTCAGGTNYYGQGNSYDTVATLTGADMGSIDLEAYATIGWIVRTVQGNWIFT